jgi:hypothetical protein
LAIREQAIGKDSEPVIALERILARFYRAQKRETEALKLERHSFR